MDIRATILVVDDNPDIVDLLRGTLAEEGYRVLVARTVAEGREILAAFRVGLVLTDAFHAAERWANLEPLMRAAGDTPIVLCSAHSADKYADHAAHGIAALLPKPFKLDALVALVGSLLPVGGRPLPVAAPEGAHAAVPAEG